VYTSYFTQLLAYAYAMLKSEQDAEEAVQQVFLRLWEKKEIIDITSSLNAYLYKSVYNACLNQIRSQKVHSKFQVHTKHQTQDLTQSDATQIMDRKDLSKRLTIAMNGLPEQCRTVFQLSRFQDLKYSEIAHYLGIAPKTVEQHMSKALKALRLELVDFLILAIAAIGTLKSITL
jgi:RNA polymerase sigma-70 factor, ECF subfamily